MWYLQLVSTFVPTSIKVLCIFLNPLLLLRYRVRQSITSFFEQFFVILSTQKRCNDARFYDYYNRKKDYNSEMIKR